jgi:DNA-binding transcriptional MerR regulator
VTSAAIPNRPLFRAQEVCELADVQAYVLRSWEAEFPDLGVSKAPAGPRFYRRADVERVLRIKQLVFVDGLTLAGARRRLSEEGLTAPAPDAEAVTDADVAALMNETVRQEVLSVRRGLAWVLGVLSGSGLNAEDFVLKAPPRAPAGKSGRAEARRGAASAGKARSAARPARPGRKAKGRKK